MPSRVRPCRSSVATSWSPAERRAALDSARPCPQQRRRGTPPAPAALFMRIAGTTSLAPGAPAAPRRCASPAVARGPPGQSLAESTYSRLLRERNFLRIFTAGLGSYAGSAIAAVCLVWIVADATHSALDIAFLGIAALLAEILFSTLGGTLVDRYDRRRLMILSDVARAAALGLVAAVLPAARAMRLPVAEELRAP